MPKPSSSIAVSRTVRLRRPDAMEIQRLSNGGGLEDAKRYLRMIRPQLDETAIHEVAWRCEDPRDRGGITTGTDDAGDWVQVAVTD